MIPSYHQGFARNRGDSEYPWSWDNVFRMMAPALGSTGVDLLDWSVNKIDGVLTLMDPDVDYVISGNPRLPGYALNFDSDNDYVALGTLGTFGSAHLGGRTSYEFWVQVNDTGWETLIGTISDGTALILTIDINREPDVSVTQGAMRIHLRQDGSNQVIGGLAFDSGISDGSFHHLVVQIDGAGDLIEIWIDGISQSITYTQQTSPSAPADIQYSLSLAARNVRGSQDHELGCDIQLFTLRTDWLTANQIKDLYGIPLAPFVLRSRVVVKAPAVAGGRVMSSLVGAGGLAGAGGIAGSAGGLAG